jgi:hypothetical protein
MTEASRREQEEGQAESARPGRKLTKSIAQVLQLLPPGMMQNYFGTLDQNAI